MNCIICGMAIVTARMARGGEMEFTPHFARNGKFKCANCGPFKRTDLMAAPFAVPRNAIAKDVDGDLWMFCDSKWRVVNEDGIADWGRDGALTSTDNFGPYEIEYYRN